MAEQNVRRRGLVWRGLSVQETLYPQSNALQFAVRSRAPVGGRKVEHLKSPWTNSNSKKCSYFVQIFTNRLFFQTRCIYKLTRKLSKSPFTSHTCIIIIFFAHGVFTGRQACAHCALRAQIKMLCDLQRNNVKCIPRAAALRRRGGDWQHLLQKLLWKRRKIWFKIQLYN